MAEGLAHIQLFGRVVMILLPLMFFWVRKPLHFASTSRWSWGIGLALTLMVTWPTPSGNAAPWNPAAMSGMVALEGKQREGTRVSGLVGNVEEVGRRWTFTSDAGDISYRLLENQSLERIAKAYRDDPTDCHWKVSGQLTEFMDENFLLLDRTERAARAKTPE